MKYINFLFRKVLKDKIFIIPFILMTIFISFIYYNNYKSAYLDIDYPIFSGENERNAFTNDIRQFQSEMDGYEKGSNDYKISSDNYNMALNRLYYMEERLNAIKEEDWKKYYVNDAELLNITINTLEEDSNFYDREVIDILKTTKDYDLYMAENNLGFDSRFSSTQGISYMVKVMDDFLPIMLVISLLFILSKIYCSSYIEKLDIHVLLPYSYFEKQIVKLFFGASIGIGIVLFVSFVSVLCGFLGNRIGNFLSPILLYSVEGTDAFCACYVLILKCSILIVLSILFLTNFVSFISKITKKNMICLLTSLGIIMLCLIVLQDLAPLQRYIHLLPTTYLNAIKVISGELAFTSYNINVNFIHGVIVLMVVNGFLFVLNYFLSKNFSRSVSRR